MKSYVFKTQCLIDGAAYIGVHSTWDLEWHENTFVSKVYGQGSKLKNKIATHGISNFRTSVLGEFLNREDAEKRKSEILTPEVLENPLCLNVSPEEFSATVADGKLGFSQSEETKEKISKSMISHYDELKSPENVPKTTVNNVYRWIHNPTTGESMKIPLSEIKELGIPSGFVKGPPTKEIAAKFVQDKRKLEVFNFVKEQTF